MNQIILTRMELLTASVHQFLASADCRQSIGRDSPPTTVVLLRIIMCRNVSL